MVRFASAGFQGLLVDPDSGCQLVDYAFCCPHAFRAERLGAIGMVATRWRTPWATHRLSNGLAATIKAAVTAISQIFES